MMPFDLAFPEIAKQEARSFLVQSHGALPSGTYVFREFYCAEPRCDCRRVLFHVHWVEGGKVAASINYGFEPPEERFADEGQIFLDPLNPQTSTSDVLVSMFEEMIDADPAYRDRLISHYEMWKDVVDDETHPQHEKLRSPEHNDPNFKPAFRERKPFKRTGPKIGLNSPCPCGSGLKYKKCCRG